MADKPLNGLKLAILVTDGFELVEFAIPKASNLQHIEENARAGALDLGEADRARIDAAFPLDPRPRPLPML